VLVAMLSRNKGYHDTKKLTNRHMAKVKFQIDR
jgi:hypothetical protein